MKQKSNSNNPNKPEPERKRYTPQFKEQALELTLREGVPKAAKDLGIAETMIYSWRARRNQTGQSFEEQKLQQAELARLKREVNRLAQENEFLKKCRRTLPRNRREVRHDKTICKNISCQADVSPFISFHQWLL